MKVLSYIFLSILLASTVLWIVYIPQTRADVDPLSVTLTPVSVTVDVGQSASFTATASGGTPPYSYHWCANGHWMSIDEPSIRVGGFAANFTVFVNVTDSVGSEVMSNVVLVIVNPLPSVTISPTSVVMNISQNQTFTSTVSGGTPPYSYEWYFNGTPVSGATDANWTFTSLSVGYFKVYVTVTDNVQKWVHSNLANLTVNGLVHDVVVTDIVPDKTVVGQGYCTDIDVMVGNVGNYTETFAVALYANSTQIGMWNVTLSEHNLTKMTLTWNTTDLAMGNYVFGAAAEAVPNEYDTENNLLIHGQVAVLIPGDVTSATLSPDGTVNMRDIGLICFVFGHPNWNVNCDIDGDDLVNMRDIGIACSNFGKHA